MKKQLLIYLLIMYSISSFAQDKAMLTKDETINYIKKKISEIEFYNTKGSRRFFFDNIRLNDCRLQISYKNWGAYDYSDWCGGMHGPNYSTNICDQVDLYLKENIVYEFDINKIKDIIIGESSNTNIGFIKIILNSNSASKKLNFSKFVKKRLYCNLDKSYSFFCVPEFEDKTELSTYILIPYYKIDESNFNKLKKAFEHLKDLCKAEDDPFGE